MEDDDLRELDEVELEDEGAEGPPARERLSVVDPPGDPSGRPTLAD